MLATKLRSFEEAFDLLNARFFENALSKSVTFVEQVEDVTDSDSLHVILLCS